MNEIISKDSENLLYGQIKEICLAFPIRYALRSELTRSLNACWRRIRQFYLTFPIRCTLCHELSWTHYRLIMRVKDEKARCFYIDECIKSNWSTRQLERQINTLFYQRLLSSQDKAGVSAAIQQTAPSPDPRDFINRPLSVLQRGHDVNTKASVLPT